MTKEQFEEKIIELWFTIRWKYPNAYIYDWEWEKTPFRVRMDCIEINKFSSYSIIVWFDRIQASIEDNALTISDINGWENPSFFLQMYNFPRK